MLVRLCVSGGAGTNEPCDPIPSQLQVVVRSSSIEANAALTVRAIDTLNRSWDVTSGTTNDGFFWNDAVAYYDSIKTFIPTRAFAIAFRTYCGLYGRYTHLTHDLPFEFIPNGNLEFRLEET